VNPYLAVCRAPGPIDTSLLEALQIRGRGGRGLEPLNAHAATDSEFLKWYIERLDTLDCRNRLRWRYLMLAALDEAKAFKEIHWVQ